MVKKIAALLLALMLVMTAGSSIAELKLWDKTPAQQTLKSYMANVNDFLLENGEEVINKLFDQTTDVVEMGVTLMDSAYIPEHVTVTVYMHYDSIHYLVLRVDDASRFPQIAAAFLRALNPATMTQEQSMKVPAEKAARAIKAPADSFEDVEIDKYKDRDTEIMNGTKPQTYYSYYPNQYQDYVNWMQLMIIFPLDGYWDAENGVITETEENSSAYRDEDWDPKYDGYFSQDIYSHYENYATPTPEPDSAAALYDEWNQ